MDRIFTDAWTLASLDHNNESIMVRIMGVYNYLYTRPIMRNGR